MPKPSSIKMPRSESSGNSRTRALSLRVFSISAIRFRLDRFEEADRNFEKSQKLSLKLNLMELYIQAKYNRAYLSFLGAGTAKRFRLQRAARTLRQRRELSSFVVVRTWTSPRFICN